MALYSFVAIAREECGIPDPMIQLGVGANVFTAHTNDLPALLETLREKGVDVKQVNNLSEHEAFSLEENILLPHERGLSELTSGDHEAPPPEE